MSDNSRLQKLTIIQAVLFFSIAGACIVATFVLHVSAFLFLGIAIAACTIVSLIGQSGDLFRQRRIHVSHGRCRHVGEHGTFRCRHGLYGFVHVGGDSNRIVTFNS